MINTYFGNRRPFTGLLRVEDLSLWSHKNLLRSPSKFSFTMVTSLKEETLKDPHTITLVYVMILGSQRRPLKSLPGKKTNYLRDLKDLRFLSWISSFIYLPSP